ncbi:MAG: hypothetical protein K9G34_10810, partial [Melioribacteraceae bacterium]|nr:hypothetical protein [Melioribacteraceae bacterium]
MKRILLLYFVFTLTAMAQTELISSFDSTGTDSGFWQTFIISEGDERIYTTLHSDTSSGSRLIPSLEYEDKIEGNAAMKIDYGVISTWTYPRTGGDVALHHTLGDNELYDFSMFDTLSISLKVLSSNPFYTEDVTSNDIELFLILFDVSNTDDYQVDGFNSEIEYYSCRIYTINSPDTDWQVIKIPLENTSDYYSSSGFALAQDFLLDRGIVGNGVLDKDKIRGFALEFHLVSFPGIQQQLIEGELLIDNFYAFGNSALPVELISFTCASNQNNIRLDWRTNMEIDNYGFEVQRDNSIMEDNTKVGWKSIGFLEGKGNTTEPQT